MGNVEGYCWVLICGRDKARPATWQGHGQVGGGTVYGREWKCNMNHSRGMMCYLKGNVYEGNWKANKKNGQGSMRYVDDNVYNGEFVEIRAHGRCNLKHSNRNVYNGEWL